jgi:hypothetical protein
MPPNHRLFDNRPTKLSPVLQRRRDAQNQAVPAAATPTFNFTIGREVIDLLRGNLNVPYANPGTPAPPYQDSEPVPPVAMPALNSAIHVPKYDVQCPTLLQSDRLPGPDMTITDFCAQNELGDGTLQKFNAHGYERARVLRFITLDDVTKMGLRLGEIAELRDAIERWSVARK